LWGDNHNSQRWFSWPNAVFNNLHTAKRWNDKAQHNSCEGHGADLPIQTETYHSWEQTVSKYIKHIKVYHYNHYNIIVLYHMQHCINCTQCLQYNVILRTKWIRSRASKQQKVLHNTGWNRKNCTKFVMQSVMNYLSYGCDVCTKIHSRDCCQPINKKYLSSW